MNDQQVARLAAVVRTRLALEAATDAHDEAIRNALGTGLGLRVVAASTHFSPTKLHRRHAPRNDPQ